MRPPKIRAIKLKRGGYSYRFTVDVAPKDLATGKRLGPRDQETHTFDTLAEAEAELARITRELAFGVYVRRADPTRKRAARAGKILAEDLFRSGQCTPNCMHAWNEKYVRLIGCACPCGGKYHGTLADTTVSASSERLEGAS